MTDPNPEYQVQEIKLGDPGKTLLTIATYPSFQSSGAIKFQGTVIYGESRQCLFHTVDMNSRAEALAEIKEFVAKMQLALAALEGLLE